MRALRRPVVASVTCHPRPNAGAFGVRGDQGAVFGDVAREAAFRGKGLAVNTNRIAKFKAGSAPLVLGLAMIASPAYAQVTSAEAANVQEGPAQDEAGKAARACAVAQAITPAIQGIQWLHARKA